MSLQIQWKTTWQVVIVPTIDSMRRMEQYFPVPVGLTNPRSSGSKFLALGLFDDSEVEMNGVLGEGDNITFIVRI